MGRPLERSRNRSSAPWAMPIDMPAMVLNAHPRLGTCHREPFRPLSSVRPAMSLNSIPRWAGTNSSSLVSVTETLPVPHMPATCQSSRNRSWSRGTWAATR